MLTGTIVAILAAMLPLSALLELVNIGTLVAFGIVCAGVLVLRVVAPQAPRPFRAPLAPMFAIAGAAACAYLISGLSPLTWKRFALWFIVGAAVYAAYGYRRSRLAAAASG